MSDVEDVMHPDFPENVREERPGGSGERGELLEALESAAHRFREKMYSYRERARRAEKNGDDMASRYRQDEATMRSKAEALEAHARRLRRSTPYGEPVAYRWRWPDEERWSHWSYVTDRSQLPPIVRHEIEHTAGVESAEVQPLYDHPAPDSEGESDE